MTTQVISYGNNELSNIVFSTEMKINRHRVGFENDNKHAPSTFSTFHFSLPIIIYATAVDYEFVSMKYE